MHGFYAGNKGIGRRAAATGVSIVLSMWLPGAAVRCAPVSHGQLFVRQFNNSNSNYGAAEPAVWVDTPYATPDVTVFGANRGDYDIDFGPGLEPREGVLITCVAELERDNSAEGDDAVGPNYASSSVARASGNDTFFIPVFACGGSAMSSGSEYNANVNAAYFRFTDGWLGGTAYNATNNAEITEFIASTNLHLGGEFVNTTGGVFTVALPGVTNTRDGVLLACSSVNEDNYALTQANTNGTFTIYSRDNGANGSSTEQDGVAFVFIPFTASNVVAGRVMGDAAIEAGTDGFTVAAVGTGTYALHIDGHTPTTGTLIVTPAGGQPYNVDNIVLMGANGDHWLIQTRDLPGAGLQSISGSEAVFSFAFFPYGPGIPPPEPPVEFRHGVIAIEQLNTSNAGIYDADPSVTATVVRSNGYVRVFNANRGDVEIKMHGGYEPATGVLFSCVCENRRDNSTGGDPAGENSATAGSAISGYDYFIATAATSGGSVTSGGEFNINVAFAYFPISEGWLAGSARAAKGGAPITSLVSAASIRLGAEFLDYASGVFDLRIPGVNSRKDGVLLVCSGVNEDNFALSQALPDGTFRIFSHDNGVDGGAYEQDGVNFVYLPKGTWECALGRVRGDGQTSVASGAFTIAHSGVGEWRLSIPGQSPATGTLLVSPEGGNTANADNVVSYTPEDSGWLIQSRDLPTTMLEDMYANDEEAFSFAFFPYVARPRPEGMLILIR